jgi:hypothetical protein
MLHFALKHEAPLGLGTDDAWSKMGDIGLLVFTPALLFIFSREHGTLWWLDTGGEDRDEGKSASTSSRLFSINFWTPLLMFGWVTSFEFRVLMQSLAPYMALPPPLRSIVLTLALYLGVAVFLAHMGGRVHTKMERYVFTGCLVMGATLSGFLLGFSFPVLWLLPAGAGYFCADFYFNRSFRQYLCFVVIGVLGLSYMVKKTFWWMDYNIQAGSMSLSMQTMCFILVFLGGCAFLLPGLTMSGSQQSKGLQDLQSSKAIAPITGLVLVIVCFGTMVVETFLYAESWGEASNMSTEDAGTAYPWYLILYTSLAIAALATRLESSGKITGFHQWLLFCIAFAKLFALSGAIPEVGSHSLITVVMALLMLTMLASAPFHPTVMRPGFLTESTALGLTAVVGVLAWYWRYYMFIPFLQLIQAVPAWRHNHLPKSTAHAIPASANHLANASVMVFCSVFLLCVARRHFARLRKQWLTRVSFVCFMVGVVVAMTQPDMDVHSLAHSIHVSFFRGVSTTPIESDTGPRWAHWMLLLSTLVFACGGMSVIPVLKNSFTKLLFSLLFGISFALYHCGMNIPPSVLVYGLYCSSFSLDTFLLLQTLSPSAMAAETYGYLHQLLLLLFLVTWICQVYEFSDAAHRGGHQVLRESRVLLFATHATLHLLLSFVIQGMLSKVGGLAKDKGRTSRLSTKRRATVASPAEAALLGHGMSDTMASAGNMSTVLSFTLLVVLIVVDFDLSIAYLVLSSPILLLLRNTTTGFFSVLSAQNRYAPMYSVVFVALAASVMYELFGKGLVNTLVSTEGRTRIPSHIAAIIDGGEATASLWTVNESGWFTPLKNLVLFACSLPNTVGLYSFLWGSRRHGIKDYLFTAPLSFFPVVLGDLIALQLLGVTGLLGCAIVWKVQETVQFKGSP